MLCSPMIPDGCKVLSPTRKTVGGLEDGEFDNREVAVSVWSGHIGGFPLWDDRQHDGDVMPPSAAMCI